MIKENECYAYFTVAGSFDPDVVTRRSGATPAQYWRKGDLNPRTDSEYKFSRWTLRSRLAMTMSLEEHVRDVLDQLDANHAAFREISVELAGNMQLVGYFYKEYPGLNFHHNLIERMASYSLSMDCDFYYMQSEELEDSQPTS